MRGLSVAYMVVIATALLAFLLIGQALAQCPGTPFCDNTAEGDYSVAFGLGNNAKAYASVVIGRYAYTNLGIPRVWNAKDDLFVAGNGNTTNKANALVLTKSGDLHISGTYFGDSISSESADLAAEGISFGQNTIVNGKHGVAFGIRTTVNGDAGVSFGQNTRAQSYASFAIGRYNSFSGSTDSWVDTDPLFVAGNGASESTRTNALTLLKNGDLSVAGRFTATQFNIPGSSAAGQSSHAFGSNSLANAPYSTTFGQTTNAFGEASIAFGVSTSAEGTGSIAGGIGTIASPQGSLVIGSYNVPSSDEIFAIGGGSSDSVRKNVFSISTAGDVTTNGVVSSGQIKSTTTNLGSLASAAFGSHTSATGVSAVSMGLDTDATPYGSLVIGRFNAKSSASSPTEWKSCDTLFSAGNGKSDNQRHDALRLYKNGMMYLSGFVFHFSDSRYVQATSLDKTGVLGKFMNLAPVSFHWNADEAEIRNDTKDHVGILAQNMHDNFPDLVFTSDDGHMSVDYSRLSVFTVQAVKEMSQDYDTRIKTLTTAVNSLKAVVNKEQDTIKDMLKLLCQHRRYRKRKQHIMPVTGAVAGFRDDDDDDDEHNGDREITLSCKNICKSF